VHHELITDLRRHSWKRFLFEPQHGPGDLVCEFAWLGFCDTPLDEDLVLAATRGEVFGLEAATGRIVWKNNMPAQGYGLASIATATGASNAALMAEEQKRQQAAGAAAASTASS